jgi:hypothetical protein
VLVVDHPELGMMRWIYITSDIAEITQPWWPSSVLVKPGMNDALAV